MCLGSPPSKLQGEIQLRTGLGSKVALQNWTVPRQQRLSIVKWSCLDDQHQVQKINHVPEDCK